MYELFLLGHSCAEIAKANDNRFPVGMILDARIRHEWDKHRKEAVEHLFREVGGMVRQRQLEGAMFLGDMLAAAHKQYGHQLRKFIQTRDTKDLPDAFKVDSITKYKMVIDALIKITGQDKKDAPGPAVQVFTNNATLQEAAPNSSIKSEDAFAMLKALQQMDEEKGKK